MIGIKKIMRKRVMLSLPFRLLVVFYFLLASEQSIQASDVVSHRIAVAGGSITEMIYRLGKGNQIVGVDSTSVYPFEAQQHPQLGYVRNISAEGVLSLNPDFLIGEPDMGPDKVVAQVKKSGVNTVVLEDDNSISGLKHKINTIANLVDAKQQGQLLLNDIQVDIDALECARNRVNTSPRVLFLLALSNGTPTAAGHTTSAHTVIVEAGGKNVLETHEGWQKLSPESALALDPDVIIVMDREPGILDEVRSLAHFKYTSAVKNQQVYSIDGVYLLSFGPRTVQAIVELGTMIHPKFPLPDNYSFRYPSKAEVVNGQL